MKQVLGRRRSPDRTVGIHEDWSWGPIGEHRIRERIAFMKSEVPVPWDDYWDDLPEKHAEFWGVIEAWPGDRLIWVGSRSALEQSGYLAFLHRFPGSQAAVVRPDDHLPPHPRFGVVGVTGSLNADQMAEVLDRAERKSVARDEHLFGRWGELIEEGALLRVLDDERAVASAPQDAHDHFILDALSRDWTWSVRVVPNAMAKTLDAKVSLSDDLLFSRLTELVEQGVAEADGEVLARGPDARRLKTLVRLAH